jgi:hypothetical protein
VVSRPAVERLAGVADHEEAVALDHQVGGPAGGLRGALAEVGRDAGQAHTQTDLRRVGAAVAALRGTGAAQQLAQGVLEDGLARLEAGGVDVGDVVAGDIHHGLVRTQATDAGEQ